MQFLLNENLGAGFRWNHGVSYASFLKMGFIEKAVPRKKKKKFKKL